MNAPTCAKLHPSTPRRNTGTPTTNQMSRAPKRKNRARQRTLISRLFDKRSLQPALTFDLPISRGSDAHEPNHTTVNTPAMIHKAPANPAVARRKLPRKKPAPLRAFFEPVSRATHLNRVPFASGGTSTLI